MKKEIISLLLLQFVSATWAQVADTNSVQQRAYEQSAAGTIFSNKSYQNPALNFYRQSFSLSALSIIGEWSEESTARQAELGDGRNGFSFTAESYTYMAEDARAWGNAYYSNATLKNVQWNESSDYELLYPYVAADTIGGDMKSETYFFKGGYAKAYKRWTFGGEFSYRALQEYRDIDPRPNNKVADLEAKVGTSFQLLPSYAAALFVEARKYKQNGSLTYYDELGVSKTFHLIGLGNSYTRFDGTRTSVRYQGHSFGMGINVLPLQNDGGWSILANYLNTFYEKILPATDDITLNEINEHYLQSEMAWSTIRHRQFLGLKLGIDYKNREGTENIFGEQVNNQLPWISCATRFANMSWKGTITACYEQNPSYRWRWSLQPSIGYHHDQEIYKGSEKQMKYSLWHSSLSFSSALRWKKDMLQTSLNGLYQGKIDASLHLDEATAHPFAIHTVQQNFNMQTAGTASYGMTVKWLRNIGTIAGYAEIHWQQIQYDNSENCWTLAISAGVNL